MWNCVIVQNLSLSSFWTIQDWLYKKDNLFCWLIPPHLYDNRYSEKITMTPSVLDVYNVQWFEHHLIENTGGLPSVFHPPEDTRAYMSIVFLWFLFQDMTTKHQVYTQTKLMGLLTTLLFKSSFPSLTGVTCRFFIQVICIRILWSFCWNILF